MAPADARMAVTIDPTLQRAGWQLLEPELTAERLRPSALQCVEPRCDATCVFFSAQEMRELALKFTRRRGGKRPGSMNRTRGHGRQLAQTGPRTAPAKVKKPKPPKHVLRRDDNGAYARTNCTRCECSMCPSCVTHVTRWVSPTGQRIESITTRTKPPFNFAYIPGDLDMARMSRTLILEPLLTLAWYQQTASCCAKDDGLIVDVGGNVGWFTLYSLALGCRVAVFEPIPAFQEVMRLGLSLNPGFASRVTLYSNVVYDAPGTYQLRVPRITGRGGKRLGMTGMVGSAGILKTDWTAKATMVDAASVRIDDILDRDVCLLKADGEGYEPQVLQTAQRLLSARNVPALQLELTRTPKSVNQARRRQPTARDVRAPSPLSTCHRRARASRCSSSLTRSATRCASRTTRRSTLSCPPRRCGTTCQPRGRFFAPFRACERCGGATRRSRGCGRRTASIGCPTRRISSVGGGPTGPHPPRLARGRASPAVYSGAQQWLDSHDWVRQRRPRLARAATMQARLGRWLTKV